MPNSKTTPSKLLPLTLDDLRSRPALTVAEGAWVMRLGLNSMYAAVRAGDVPSVRIGGRIVIPTKKLLALLGEDGD